MNQTLLFTSLLFTSALALSAAEVKPVAGDPLSDAQRIAYHLGQTPTVPVELKWKTIFVLPSSEKLLDVCGFRDDWDVYAPRDSNFAMVQPLKAGARTDLAFVTKAGNIYTFAVQDVSGQAGAHAYTQVLIDAADDKMRAAINAEPKYYGSDDVAAFRAQAEKAEKASQELTAKATKEMEDAQTAGRLEAAKQIKHDYRYDQAAAAKAPWNIVSIWHDAKFSYIEATPSEQFALYEVVDGKPTAINIFPEGNGSFRTDRVIDAGYMKLGKKQLNFSR